MANLIEIRDAGLCVQVAPNNGGMVAQATVDGTDVFLFNEGAAETTPMSAGGSPVLFPFPSRTKDDTYQLDGQAYAMPVHGLVKNAAFAVKEVTEKSVTLWYDGSKSQQQANYPFDYALEITYRVQGASLFSTARITNNSGKPMPHYLGWHPYFKATDKTRLRFEHSMTAHYDYVECKDLPTVENIDLSQRWDDVFHTSTKKEFTLVNEADRYRVKCVFDDAHNVIVICSWVEGAVCLEPWCGLPNSINNGRFVKWIQPGETESYTVEYQLERI